MAAPTTPGPSFQPPQEITIVDGEILETHKENIAPSRDGRSAMALAQMYSIPRAQRAKELASKHAQYRQAITEAELQYLTDFNCDLLEPYWQYVKWTMNNYPSGNSSESGLLQLLEEATRKLYDDPMCKNDLRYVNLWREYANLIEQPERVYAFMLANEIGTHLYTTYEEYAIALERSGNRAKADGVYSLGIARKVKGYQRLQDRYKEFTVRCLAAPNPDVSSPAPAEATPAGRPPVLGGRAVLGTRSVSAPLGGLVRPNSDVFTETPRSNLGKVRVFADSDSQGNTVETNQWDHLDSRSAATKENAKEATGWKGNTLRQTGLQAPRTPKIPIFRDETAGPSAPASVHSPEAVFRPVQRSLKAEDDLVRNPFKNYESSAKLDFDLPALPKPPPSIIPMLPPEFAPPAPRTNAVASSSKSMPPPPPPSRPSMPASKDVPYRSQAPSVLGPKPPPPVYVPLPGKRAETLAVDLSNIYMDGEEYSRDEARARSLGLLGKRDWPPPPVHVEYQVALKEEGEKTGAVKRSRRKSTVNFVTTSPTTNTKAALNDVFDMFNTTQDEEDDGGFEDETEKEDTLGRSPPRMMTALDAGYGGVPPTPTPSGSAKSFTPFIDENQRSTFTPRIIPRSVSTPTHLSTNSLSNTTPLAGRGLLSSASAPLFSVAQDPQPAQLKMKVFTPLGEKRLPSTLRPTPAATPLGSKTPFAPFVDPPPQAQQADQNPQKSAIRAPLSSKKIPIFMDAPPPRAPAADTMAVLEPSSILSPIPPRLFGLKGPVAKFLSPRDDHLFSPVSLPRRESSDSRSPAEPRIQALSVSPTDVDPTPEQIAEPEVSFHSEDGGVGDDSEIDDGDEGLQAVYEGEGNEEEEEEEPELRPRSYVRKGGVAIMSPITERTMEYTSTRLLEGGLRPISEEEGLEEIEEHRESNILPDELVNKPRRARASTRPSFGSTTGFASFDEIRDAPFLVAEGHTIRGPRKSEALGPAFMPPNPCNPFHPKILSDLLHFTSQEFDDSDMHRDLRDIDSKTLALMQKFAKKQSASRKSSAPIPEELLVTLGEMDYSVMEKIGEGGFGAVFLAKDNARAAILEEAMLGEDEEQMQDADDALVAIKAVNPAMIWESTILRRIRRLLSEPAGVALIQPHEFYLYQNESFLILDYSNQGTLLESVNKAAQIGVAATDTSGINELLVMFFSIELLRIVEELHANGFIHGDLKIDNCLLRLSELPASEWDANYDPNGGGGWADMGIRLIDFGRSIDTTLFPEGQTFVGDWPTDARDCVEMREGRSWTYQTDYSGLAGIIYCMLFGKYIETTTRPDGRIKLATPFKRYWQADTWTRLFDLLLNPCSARPDGHLPLCEEIAAIQGEMETWLADNCQKKNGSLKGMLRKMQQFAIQKRF